MTDPADPDVNDPGAQSTPSGPDEPVAEAAGGGTADTGAAANDGAAVGGEAATPDEGVAPGDDAAAGGWTAGVGATPGDEGAPGGWTAGAGAAPGEVAAPGDGPAPDSVVLPGFPPPPAPPASRAPRNVAGLAWGGVAVAIVVGVLVYALVAHLNSTSSVRVIIPAPAVAGGLHQDYADEGSSQYRAAIAQLRQRFGPSGGGVTLGAAIYTNAAAGSSARSATNALLYLGFNGPHSAAPAAGLKSLLSGVGHQLAHAAMVQEGGGPGDTRFACETGSTGSTGSQITVCAWATDRTAGLLVPQIPGATPGQLSALMKKMEPDLVRG